MARNEKTSKKISILASKVLRARKKLAGSSLTQRSDRKKKSS